jgi:ketosteroid isomerase-like protein
MSNENVNVEIVSRVPEALNSGGIDTVLALQNPAWEGFIPAEYPMAGTWRGHDSLRAFAEEWLEAWEELRVKPEDFTTGGEAVLATVHYWGRGRGSGIEVRERWHYAYRLRAGKVLSWRRCADRAHALADLGLAD